MDTQTATQVMNSQRNSLAGRQLVKINHEEVGPWSIEANQKINQWEIEILDITVWIGGRMVGIQLTEDATITTEA